MSDSVSIRNSVANLYNTYPFPPEPLLDEPPPGYNWRWNWLAAYNFCYGRRPTNENVRILDAGCGTGVGTEYLIYLNPQAEVVGIDISEKALSVAQERCQRSGVAANHSRSISFHQLNLEEASQLSGEFDLINCVGVLHHLPDPIAGIKSLANKLAPGGLLHIFVYSEIGRWEIQLVQQAIALLQGNKRGDYSDGVNLGRQLFSSLPESNRLVKRERERWSMENHRDESFADMYVHPQEIDYNIYTLFELIDACGLDFLGFSNPSYWNLERLVEKSPLILERAAGLSERERYRLIELLDPEITHYEFFLAKKPYFISDWSEDAVLLKARVERHPCITGWPSMSVFNYDYQLVKLSEAEYRVLEASDPQQEVKPSVGDLLSQLSLELETVKSLAKRQLIILTPTD